ncbi:hypothetical protein QJS10_CPA06g01851 [Acorus calamus]|uniref:Uncharacterized protein n=1 Tax=Acorus calamus TaxID=4465 RepID=A0AAV9ELV1_ACOCL|nr:hypothetical protein QJS10_CPA06g01851 [Acorus calamus]
MVDTHQRDLRCFTNNKVSSRVLNQCAMSCSVRGKGTIRITFNPTWRRWTP